MLISCSTPSRSSQRSQFAQALTAVGLSEPVPTVGLWESYFTWNHPYEFCLEFSTELLCGKLPGSSVTRWANNLPPPVQFTHADKPIGVTPLPPRHIPRIILWHKSAKILLPHHIFASKVWNSIRLHYARPFRSYEPPFIVRACLSLHYSSCF